MICRLILGLLVAVGIGAHASDSSGPVFVPFFTDADWAVTEVNDPTGLAPVTVVQRFEVRPGQCVSRPPFHDCERGVERAELGQAIVPRGSRDTHWYRWQVFFPEDFVTAYPVRNRHGQFVDHGAGESAWAFEIGSTGVLWLGSQFDDESRYFSVINQRDLRGEWHDVIVEAAWSREDGRLNVWVNGEERVRYRGVTCNRCQIALTYGIARHGVNKFTERYPQKTLPVQITYYLAAEVYSEDPGWIVAPPPPEPEEATGDDQADQETVREPESQEEKEGGHQEGLMEGSIVSQQPEADSSGTGPAQEDQALDEVTIASDTESDSATAPQTIEPSDSVSTLDSTDQPTKTTEVSAEDQSVEETVSAEVEEQNSSSDEAESTSIEEPEDISTEGTQKPLSSDTDDRR